VERRPASANIEPPVEPDLLEALADEELTLFGMTGTLRDLAEKCPVDLADPRITMEMKNTFVVKAVNEAGLTIKPEYESVFNRIIEEKGLERKFSVLKADENTRTEVATKENLQTREAVLPTASPAQAAARAAKETVVRQQAELVARISEEEAVVAAAPSRSEKIIIKPIEVQPETLVSPTQTLLKAMATKKPLPLVAESGAKIIEAVPVGASELEAEATVDVEPATSLEMLLAELVPEGMQEVQSLGVVVTEVAGVEPVHVAEVVPVVVLGWEMELAKEPLEVYEDFEMALREFTERKTSVLSGEEAGTTVDEGSESGVRMILIVAERLAALDVEEREVVAPTLKDIVGALHGLELLEAREVGPEVIATVEAKLEESVVALLEALGITYDEETVRLFINGLRDREFKPAPLLPSAIDLERTGTHEVKRQFAHLASAFVRVEHRFQRTLGRVALSATRFSELSAAA